MGVGRDMGMGDSSKFGNFGRGDLDTASNTHPQLEHYRILVGSDGPARRSGNSSRSLTGHKGVAWDKGIAAKALNDAGLGRFEERGPTDL